LNYFSEDRGHIGVLILKLNVTDLKGEVHFLTNLISSLSFLFVLVFGIQLIFHTQILYAKSYNLTEVPHYKIDVSYDHDETLLVGKMQVRFNRSAFPDNELLFALPGNRFRKPDERGVRKHKIVPVFSIRRFQDNFEDPKTPTGFSRGSLGVTSVSAHSHNPTAVKLKLKFSIEPNPDLEVGYSTSKGLLRVKLPKDLPDSKDFPGQSTVFIEFYTHFPEHVQEGKVNGMLLTSNWHPKLISWNEEPAVKAQGWETEGNNPSLATFEVTWKAAQAGTLITTTGHQKLQADQSITFAEKRRPLKYFPLIFTKVHQRLSLKTEKVILDKKSASGTGHASGQLTSFYIKGHERRAELIHHWSKLFLEFVHARYGLQSPWESFRIVAVEAEYEQVDVLNNLILVPIPNYKRSEFLDRQALGFLTRRLAQLWFGESVLNNQDTQLWLNLGLPAFLGLRFFQEKYGPDAGIFDSFDWLNPKYRDHFYENMANTVSPELSYPILSSFRNNPESQKYLQTLTYKTAMVLSMLEYLMGNRAFRQGLQHFAQNNQGVLAGQKEFQVSMEKFNDPKRRVPPLPSVSPYGIKGKGSLDWFFSQWFRTVQTLDYSFERSTIRTLSDGMYETEIIINKNDAAKMPVVVALRTKDGREFRRTSPGLKQQEKVFIKTADYPEQVSIDPDEELLESSRINNHSFSFYRVRLGFDWKKQREHLVLMVPGFGNNAIDGNSFGIGVKYRFNDYRLYAIPGYGTKNKRGLYIFNFDRENLGINGLEAGFSAREYGGVRSEAIRATFKPAYNSSKLDYKFHSSLSRETLFAARNTSENGKIFETGKLNSFFLEHSGGYRLLDNYLISWNIWNEQPSLQLESDFSYVRWQGTLGQKLHVGHRKWLQLDIIHGTTEGETPLQKKFLLGSPAVLRGFPQHTVLSDDRLMASRFDYKFPLVTAPLWGIVSAFKIQGTVFYDQGKLWSNNITFEKAKHRQNAGFGIEWTVDTASLFQVPLKLEVAFPINDQDYKKPQFIFLGVLTGS
jgi:hypothetical protein